MNKGLMAVGALAIAGASAAIGWYGVKLLVEPDAQAGAEPAVTPTEDAAATIPVTFDAQHIESEAAGLFTPPACGEEWSSPAQPANGVVPEVSVTNDATGATANVSFVTTEEQALAFLAQEGQIIVTRDGVVVTPDWGSEFVPEYRVASPEGPSTSSSTIEFSGASLCDVAAELSAMWDDFDWENATDEEIAARQAQAEAFENDNRDLPAGEYKVYAWTPVILGNSAAAARALIEEGFTDLAYLQYTAGYSPLADSAEIEQYCEESPTPDGSTELLCDVPQDVLATLLQRDVPEHYVIEATPAVAISEAATFTIE
ncbi:hypothetical protein [Demequina activiva]|nr:hypothetical protein [Demequina activiva]